MDSTGRMDKGFLTEQQRTEMKAILRRGSTPQRFARRVNAVLLLDKGMSCAQVAEVLFLDDDTVRGFHKAYVADGLAGLERFESGGSACDMSDQQIEAFVGWVDTEHPTSRRIAGACASSSTRRFVPLADSAPACAPTKPAGSQAEKCASTKSAVAVAACALRCAQRAR